MNMKKKSFWRQGILALCLACMCFACGGGEKKAPLGPSKGLPGELLLIVDASLWKTSARDSLEDVLKGSVPGLSQHEPMFRMIRIFPENYSGQYSTMRNIIEVREDPQADGVEMGVAYNVKAVPQTYVNIKVRDVASLNHFLMTHREQITDLFLASEMQWEAARLKKKYSKIVDDASRELFGYTVKVPADIAKVKKGEQFIWASSDRQTQDMNYVCYSLPLADSSMLLTKRWVELRDSVMKRNIPGSTPENWMTTTRENGEPLVVQRSVQLADGRQVYEMRGLWEMRKGALGGPFVSLVYPDSAQGRLLVTEGFIYSPDTNKRDLVRRMEAALRTLAPVKP